MDAVDHAAAGDLPGERLAGLAWRSWLGARARSGRCSAPGAGLRPRRPAPRRRRCDRAGGVAPAGPGRGSTRAPRSWRLQPRTGGSRALDPELECVLDGDDPRLLREQLDQCVEEGGLSPSRCPPRRRRASGGGGPPEHSLREGPLDDEVPGGERAAPEPADRHRHMGAGRWRADGDPRAVLEPGVQYRPRGVGWWSSPIPSEGVLSSGEAGHGGSLPRPPTSRLRLEPDPPDREAQAAPASTTATPGAAWYQTRITVWRPGSW